LLVARLPPGSFCTDPVQLDRRTVAAWAATTELEAIASHNPRPGGAGRSPGRA